MNMGIYVKKLLVLVGISAVLLSGCASTSNANWMEKYTNQTLTWGDCKTKLFAEADYLDAGFKKDDVVCAELIVPISYQQDLNSQDLTLTLMKDPASGATADKVGTMFSNPGGPGQSGLDYIQTVPLPQEVRDAFDVIGFDPRGVGNSSPVRCDDDLDLRSYFEYHFDYENQAQADEDKVAMDEYYQTCIDNNPTWWAMTTENVVQDLELMRKVITPKEDLNFVGHSYGTTIAAVYISNFPNQAGRMVLDSPVASSTDEIEDQVKQTKAFAKARTKLFDRCAADPKCPGDTRAEVEQVLLDLRDSALQGGANGYVAAMKGDNFFQRGNGLSPYLILHGLDLLGYYPTDEVYSIFRTAMKQAKNFDMSYFEFWGLMMDGYDGNTLERDNSFDILTIVNCLDVDSRDTKTKAERDSDTAKLEAADPFATKFYSLYDFEPADEAEPGCYWSWRAFEDDNIPDPPKKPEAYTNTSGAEFLIIGSRGDTATPFAWSENVAEDLGSPLVVYEGSGHAQLFGGIKCLDDLAIEYLLTGKVPPAGTSCKAK
jgi:pimeloyl-ACP methyl ester carboxylesterase